MTCRAHWLRSFWLNQLVFAGQSLAVVRVITGFGVDEDVHGGGAHAYLRHAHQLCLQTTSALAFHGTQFCVAEEARGDGARAQLGYAHEEHTVLSCYPSPLS